MASPLPTGLLPSEVRALRASAGIAIGDFANAFGVGANVVEHWESLGVPSGPTALAIRLVAQSMDFEFPEADPSGDPCTICKAPASESFRNLAVCASCHRDPVKSMEAIGYQVMKSQNVVSNQTTYEVRLPAGRRLSFSGRFLSEGLGTLLTKIFKDEPQIGDKAWDDAVYVQWVEPSLAEFDDGATRALIQALVTFGMLDADVESITLQNAPSWAGLEEEIILHLGLLASRKS